MSESHQPRTLYEVGVLPPVLPRAEFAQIYGRRTKRFHDMLRDVPDEARVTHQMIQSGISVSEKAHAVALESMDLIQQLIDASQMSLASQLDSFFASAAGSLSTDNPTASQVFDEARQFVREGFAKAETQPAALQGKTLGDLLRDAFPAADEVRLSMLGAAVENLTTAFMLYRKRPPALRPIALQMYSFAQTLYVGVFEVSGNQLARTDTAQKVAALLKEEITDAAIGLVGIPALAMKVSRLVASLSDPPDAVRAAADVEIYFTRYHDVAEEWIAGAEELVAASRQALASVAPRRAAA